MGKKMKGISMTLLVCIFLSSCSTSKQSQPEDKTQSPVISDNESGSAISTIDFSNSVRKTYNLEPFHLMNIEAGVPQFISKEMDQRLLETYFHGRTNEVAFKFKYETATNQLFFNHGARIMAINAVDTYFSDFEQKKLLKNENKTRFSYGKYTGRLNWKTLIMQADSEPELQFGYKFLHDNPYFTVIVKPADNINADTLKTIPGNIEMTLYFTKAQALALKKTISEEYILQELSKQDYPDVSNTPDKY
ncbi:MAG: hypothetical protein JXB03_06480 [Spirochaetales bacterium]|nr:hypothetical protein [Spirochaetales bacterium]